MAKLKFPNTIVSVDFHLVKSMRGKSIDTIHIQSIFELNTDTCESICNCTVTKNAQLIHSSPEEFEELFHGTFEECWKFATKYIKDHE